MKVPVRRPVAGAAAGLLLGLLLAAAPARAVPALAAEQVRLVPYGGRLGDDPRFASAFGDLAGDVRHALLVVEDRLGLLPEDPTRIEVCVLDADLARHGRDRARCTTREEAGGAVQRIELYAEYFVSGDSDVRTVLAHEMVHAVMRQHVAPATYRRLPYWVREGLAVDAAGQGPGHLRRTLLAEGEAEALLTGLMRERRRLVMYPYAWLAVDWLRRRGGPTAVRRLALGLAAGRDLEDLVGRIAKCTWPAFRRGVRAHARQRLEAEAAGGAALEGAHDPSGRRAWTEAREAFRALLEAHPDSAFAPTARYYDARCLYHQRQWDGAARAFADCLAEDLGRSGWVDECHLYQGLALLRLGRHEEAAAALRDYVELHPYAGRRDLGLVALGRALRALGREGRAREAFRSVADLDGARRGMVRAAARELRALDES